MAIFQMAAPWSMQQGLGVAGRGWGSLVFTSPVWQGSRSGGSSCPLLTVPRSRAVWLESPPICQQPSLIELVLNACKLTPG